MPEMQLFVFHDLLSAKYLIKQVHIYEVNLKKHQAYLIRLY